MSFRSGFITLLGRPNVGKSTLLNELVGHKISITSPKAQTTRHRLLGIRTTPASQMVFVDTPGVHLHGKRYMNRILNRAARDALAGVDIILLMITSEGWREEDLLALELARQEASTLILLVNKIDRLRDKSRLLPLLQDSAARHDFAEIVPLSATQGDNIDRLLEVLERHLPEGPLLFPEDQLTDRGERFFVSEVVREKLFHSLHREIPYALAVEVQTLLSEPGLVRADVVIWVERDSQKGIIIGKGGEQLRAIGSAARRDLEEYFARKVFLQLWVKTRENWSDDARMLRSVGYLEDT